MPFGNAVDTLALPDNAKEDLDMSSHASFSDDDAIEFNPPANSTGGEMSLADQLAAQANRLKPAGTQAEAKPVQKPAAEMTLAEQLAAQMNKLKPAGSQAAEPKPVEKPASEMTLAEQLAA